MPSFAVLLLALSVARSQDLLTDLNAISRQWGQISVYADNAEDFFGVNVSGLPSGCQVEQAHLLQRHAQRFPTSADDDGKALDNHHFWRDC